jgi:DDE superfamily endonuclease
MPTPEFNSLLTQLLLLSPAFTQPSFLRFLSLFAGWVLCSGTHAVTESLVASGIAGQRHHAAFHRFFSRARWRMDDLGRLLLVPLAAMAQGPVRLLLDDTLCHHKGPKVFGLGCHLDAVRSTRRVRQFAFGHVWVMLAVLVRVPFTTRHWALPLVFRLYRTKADNQAQRHPHQTKTQLARQMVEQVLRWLPDTPLELVADGLYSCGTLLKGLPPRLVFIGSMRPDAALSRPRQRPGRSPKTGRPLTRDVPVPKPERLFHAASVPWQSLVACLYGVDKAVEYKEVVARWKSVAGPCLLKIVLVKTEGGRLPFRVFFCTDSLRTTRQLIEGYAQRWAIEVLFRDLKQLLGFAASRARTPLAVLRTAPWVGICYSLLVLWYVQLAAPLPHLGLPLRPWYRTKQTVSFADILRLAQRTLAPADWVNPRALLTQVLASVSINSFDGAQAA